MTMLVIFRTITLIMVRIIVVIYNINHNDGVNENIDNIYNSNNDNREYNENCR